MGKCSKTCLLKVQKNQGKPASAVTGNFDNYNTSVSEIIKILGWMTMHERFCYFIPVLVYNVLTIKQQSACLYSYNMSVIPMVKILEILIICAYEFHLTIVPSLSHHLDIEPHLLSQVM